MIKELWEQAAAGNDVRQNLSRLRQEIKKEPAAGRQLAKLLKEQGQSECLLGFLKDEDAKTRKNAALLMGDLGEQDFMAPVFAAYMAETQLFVKSAYVTAMKNFDCREQMETLKARLEELTKAELTEENRKHILEEQRELSDLIVMTEGVQTHKFIGYDEKFQVVLITNRNHQETAVRELLELEPGAETEIFNSGVRASVGNLHWAGRHRTYQELLFAVKGMAACPMEAVKAAKVIAESELLPFLNRNHEGKPPYYFRVELKTKMEAAAKAEFAKRFSGELERLSGRKLINTTSRYEFEIRLVENKAGNFNLLIKLGTLKDNRFSYRKEVTALSIRPYNAALTAALTKKWMTEGGQVLDPFCGVGTMLIERHKAVGAGSSYGVDIQAEAIEKARINTEAAGQLIHFINRDFFDFKHDYLFDEIITDMPFAIGKLGAEDIGRFYRRFFAAAPALLKTSGIVILYSHDKDYVKNFAPKEGFSILEEYEISMKEGTYVFVLRKNQ